MALTPEQITAGVIRDELNRHRTADERITLATSYERDADRLGQHVDLAPYEPMYRQIADALRAAAQPI